LDGSLVLEKISESICCKINFLTYELSLLFNIGYLNNKVDR